MGAEYFLLIKTQRGAVSEMQGSSRGSLKLQQTVLAFLNEFSPTTAAEFTDEEAVSRFFFEGPNRRSEMKAASASFDSETGNNQNAINYIYARLNKKEPGLAAQFVSEAQPKLDDLKTKNPSYSASPPAYYMGADTKYHLGGSEADGTARRALDFTPTKPPRPPSSGGGPPSSSSGSTITTPGSGGVGPPIGLELDAALSKNNPKMGMVFDQALRQNNPRMGLEISQALGRNNGPMGLEMKRAVGDALADNSRPAMRNLDDEPWESTHPRRETPRLKFGGALEHSAAMRPGKESMPETPSVGNRGLARGDIINQRRLLFDPAGRSTIQRPDEKTGDVIVDSKQSMDNSTDTLRTLYAEANPQDVVPSKTEQIASDIMFDSFSTVLPGWGLGMQNKMFLMEEEHENKMLYAEPLAEPRPDIGPIGGIDAMPAEWQASISKRNRKKMQADEIREQMLASLLEQRTGSGSLNVLGDDAGFLRAVSDRGLPRDKESCFEPVVVTGAPWQPVKVPCGYDLRRVLMRKQYDALRAPAKIRPSMAQDGGPTFPVDYAFTEMYSAPSMS